MKNHGSRGRKQVFGWGGARPGAGRKPKGDKAGVSHDRRPRVAAEHPLHVRLEVQKGLPSLKRKDSSRALDGAIDAGADHFGFRLQHYAVRGNQVHLIAGAKNGRALSRGMQGLTIRVAKALNNAWDRSGRVFADRFDARVLDTPAARREAFAALRNGSAPRTPLRVLPDAPRERARVQ